MDSQTGFFYDNDLDCTVTLTTSFGRKIFIDFTTLNIEGDPMDCKKTDYLEVFDGPTKLSSLGVICGTDTYSVDPITSTTSSITIQFKTNSNVTDSGFYMTYNSFSESSIMPCMDDEFECGNGRCIDKSLTGDLYDNCGDSSDFAGGDVFNTAMGLLKWGIGVLIAIIVGIIVAIVLCCVCVGCLCYHCCCKNRQQTQYTGVTQTTGPPAYNQQPPMAMQPAGQQPYGQPAQI